MKLIIVQLLLYAVTIFLLAPNILLTILFSNILRLCTSLNVRDKVSSSYKTTGRIVVLYNLIFEFLDSRGKTRRL
jgi:hypothetical protein